MDDIHPTTHKSIDDGPTLKTSENSPISCSCKPSRQRGIRKKPCGFHRWDCKSVRPKELYSRLVKDSTQLTYYNSGIGTYVKDSKSWLSPKAWRQSFSHELDKAVATNFKSKVLDAYEWLSENYKPGDRIFLFGFSRGAYQVRVIAGMIEKVGLLHKGNRQQIPFAYDLYTATIAKRKRQEPGQEDKDATAKRDQAATTRFQYVFDLLSNIKRQIFGSSDPVSDTKTSDQTVTDDVAAKTSIEYDKPQDLNKDAFRYVSVIFAGIFTNVKKRFWDKSLADSKMTNLDPDQRATNDHDSHTVAPSLIEDMGQDGSEDDKEDNSQDDAEDDSEDDSEDNTEDVLQDGSDDSPEALCDHFKKSLSHSEVKVHFVGSWDTVSSVGILRGESLPETTTGMTHVCAFRHALALDELRVKFLPEYANGGAGPLPRNSLSMDSSEGPEGVEKAGLVDKSLPVAGLKSANKTKGGNVKEVWFPGSHSDIGGGNVRNLKNNKFGPSLRWMTYEALTWGLSMTPFDQKWVPLTPKSSMNWKWNILENLPISRLSYKGPNDVTRWPHRQSPRLILPGQLVHESVIELINPTTKKQKATKSYLPIALFPGQKKWDKAQLDKLNCIIEKDPYIQPDRILDAIAEKRQTAADYGALYTSSSAAAGLRSIHERHNAEDILASAVESECQKGNVQEKKTNVDTIARILDRCFDMIPLEVTLHGHGPRPHPSAWPVLNELFPTTSYTRSKLLHRFACHEIRTNLVKEEIQHHRNALESRSKAPEHNPIDFIKNLIIALLNSVILATPQDAAMYHRQWLRNLYSEALRLHDLSYISRYHIFVRLADVIELQFEAGQQSYLDERILLFKEFLDFTPPGHDSREDYMRHLVAALDARFEATPRQEDIDDIISLRREILDLHSSAHHNGLTALGNLASSLQERFELTGQLDDIDEAIMVQRESIECLRPTHPNRATALNCLGNRLHTRFKETGRRNDLDEEIRLYQEALKIYDLCDPDRVFPLNGLAAVLWYRFKQSGQRGDLDVVTKHRRHCLELNSSQTSHARNSNAPIFELNLAQVLLGLFKESGRQVDLDEAILRFRQALEHNLQPRHEAKFLNGLAAALRKRFEKIGQHKDLDEAISMHKKALELCHPSCLDRDSSLSGLAAALTSRFTISDQLSDLYEATELYRQALELLPSPHPRRADSLFGLAGALQSLFGQTGQQSSLDEAISLHRETLKLRPTPHVDRADSLIGLAAALQSLRKQSLSAALQSLFGQIVQQDELDEAIALLKESLELRPPPHPARAESLISLAGALLTRFGDTNHPGDLVEALVYRKELLNSKSSNPPFYPPPLSDADWNSNNSE